MEKNDLLDSMGRPLTQSLFLEIGYSDYAVYTLKEDDYCYNDKIYPSLKKLYLECEDPTEYEFATTYLIGWQHWQRLCANKTLNKYFNEWREELEIKMRSKGVRKIIKQAEEGGSYQAAKYLADRGWDKRAAGRPTKEEVEHEKAIKSRIADEFEADIKRLQDYK